MMTNIIYLSIIIIIVIINRTHKHKAASINTVEEMCMAATVFHYYNERQ